MTDVKVGEDGPNGSGTENTGPNHAEPQSSQVNGSVRTLEVKRLQEPQTSPADCDTELFTPGLNICPGVSGPDPS